MAPAPAPAACQQLGDYSQSLRVTDKLHVRDREREGEGEQGVVIQH